MTKSKAPTGAIVTESTVKATADTILVSAKVLYRGKVYKLSYEHFDDEGSLKGYRAGEHVSLLDTDYAVMAAFEPFLPTTYVAPVLAAVRGKIEAYKAEVAQFNADRMAAMEMKRKYAIERHDEVRSLLLRHVEQVHRFDEAANIASMEASLGHRVSPCSLSPYWEPDGKKLEGIE